MTPERHKKLRAVLSRRQPDLTLITDYVHKGRNLSAIVRTADAVGIGTVHCVIADKDYRAFRGTALGSHRWVEVHRYRHLMTPVEQLKSQGFQVVAAHVSTKAVDYHAVDYTRPTALLLGAEKDGLSLEAETLADIHITIPMCGMVESFNVSVAAGIILSEAQHQRQRAGFYDQCRLDDEQYQRLFFEWAHPEISAYCQQHGLVYPPVQDDGELENPSRWYAEVRDGLAQRESDYV